VGEEPLVGEGVDASHLDVLPAQAGGDEVGGVALPEVEAELALVGLVDHPRVRERGARPLGHLRPDLVALGPDRRADRGDEAHRIAVEVARHRLHGFPCDVRDGALPPRVDDADRRRVRIEDDDRDAVGDHHREDDAGVAGDQRVGVGDRTLVPGSATAPGGGRDHPHVAPVHLPGDDERRQVHAERGGEPLPVRQHRLRTVADVEAEVQRVDRKSVV
jgi:hypothetical protein